MTNSTDKCKSQGQSGLSWANVSNEIENNDKHIDELIAQINSKQLELNAAYTDISAMNAKYSELTNTISRLQGEINELTSKIGVYLKQNDSLYEEIE